MATDAKGWGGSCDSYGTWPDTFVTEVEDMVNAAIAAITTLLKDGDVSDRNNRRRIAQTAETLFGTKRDGVGVTIKDKASRINLERLRSQRFTIILIPPSEDAVLTTLLAYS